MQVFRRLPPAGQRIPCALTIGNFDGVHRGHQALLARLRAIAREHSLFSCVLTFEPHPREFFAATRGAAVAPARIATLRDKLEALRECGVDRVCVAHFNESLASLPADTFVSRILVEGLHARQLLIGDDFRFGAQRRGDFALLAGASHRHGFGLERMPTVADEGLRVSSSEVRAALAAGDFERCRLLLGRPYFISGRVVHGRKLGRTLGFPTLNLRIPHGRPALSGVFVVRVHGLAAQPLAAVASLGTRPAVESDGRWLLEVHVFDFDRRVYGALVRVEFLKKLRDEATYEGLEALSAQIARDAEQARDHFRSPGAAGGAGTDRRCGP